MGINDLSKKYELNEIVSGDSIFCATGITSGDLVSELILKTTSLYQRPSLHINQLD